MHQYAAAVASTNELKYAPTSEATAMMNVITSVLENIIYTPRLEVYAVKLNACIS